MSQDGTPTVTRPFEQSVAVFTCVTVIASALSRVPLIVVEETSGKFAEGHEGNRLLRKPNRLTPGSRFIETVTACAMLSGQGVIVRDGEQANGLPESLFPLTPDSVRPALVNGNPYALLGWEYMAGAIGRAVPIPVEHLARIEYAPDPYNPLRGVTPLGALRLTMDTDMLSRRFNKAVLSNAGVPSGLLTWKGEKPLTDDQLNEARRRWRERHEGPDNAEKTAVLGGNFEWQTTGLSPRDIQWAQLQKLSLAEVARAYKVPPLFVGEVEGSGLSKSGLQLQKQILYENAAIPIGAKLADALTELMFPAGGFRVEFDWHQVEALRDDLLARATTAQTLVAAGWPLNDVNDALDLGMPALPWGGESLVAAGMTTALAVVKGSKIDLGEPPPAPAAPPPAPAPADGTTASAPGDATPRGSRGASVERTEEPDGPQDASIDPALLPADPARVKLWRSIIKDVAPIERKMLNAQVRYIQKASRAMVQAIEASSHGGRSFVRDNADDVSRRFDPRAFAYVTKRWIAEAFDRAAKRAADDLAVSSAEAVNFQANRIPEIQSAWLDERIGRVVDVGDEIRSRVRDSLLEGYDAGESVGDLTTRVTDEMEASFFRAQRIARTETAIAMNGGRFETYKEAEIPQIQWLAEHDAATRPSHKKVDGKIVDVGEKFPGVKLRHPGDPDGAPSEICNCRCTVLPLVGAASDAGDGGDSGDTGD